jgi:hypothetical protein
MSRFSIRKARAKFVLALGRRECSAAIGAPRSTAANIAIDYIAHE